MAEQLSFSKFALIPLAAQNDGDRPGSLQLEYFQVSVTTSSDTGDVEVPTTLGEVLGVIDIGYCDEFGSGDYLTAFSTDGVITTGAVTVRVVASAGWTDGAHVIRGFLVGKKAETVLS